MKRFAIFFTRDLVTRENYWQIASFVTPKSLFTVTHALFFLSHIREDKYAQYHCLISQLVGTHLVYNCYDVTDVLKCINMTGVSWSNPGIINAVLHIKAEKWYYLIFLWNSYQNITDLIKWINLKNIICKRGAIYVGLNVSTLLWILMQICVRWLFHHWFKCIFTNSTPSHPMKKLRFISNQSIKIWYLFKYCVEHDHRHQQHKYNYYGTKTHSMIIITQFLLLLIIAKFLLNILVLKLDNSVVNRYILWMLMAWRLALPGH